MEEDPSSSFWDDEEYRPLFEDLLIKGFLNDTNLSRRLLAQNDDRFVHWLEQKMEDAAIHTSGICIYRLAFSRDLETWPLALKHITFCGETHCVHVLNALAFKANAYCSISKIKTDVMMLFEAEEE